MTDPFRVPLIIRGQIIDDADIDYGGRRGGVSFSAPDIAKHVKESISTNNLLIILLRGED